MTIHASVRVRGSKAIKRRNLELLPPGRVWVAVGVGREEVHGHDGTDPTRSVELFYSVNDRQLGQRMLMKPLSAKV